MLLCVMLISVIETISALTFSVNESDMDIKPDNVSKELENNETQIRSKDLLSPNNITVLANAQTLNTSDPFFLTKNLSVLANATYKDENVTIINEVNVSNRANDTMVNSSDVFLNSIFRFLLTIDSSAQANDRLLNEVDTFLSTLDISLRLADTSLKNNTLRANGTNANATISTANYLSVFVNTVLMTTDAMANHANNICVRAMDIAQNLYKVPERAEDIALLDASKLAFNNIEKIFNSIEKIFESTNTTMLQKDNTMYLDEMYMNTNDISVRKKAINILLMLSYTMATRANDMDFSVKYIAQRALSKEELSKHLIDVAVLYVSRLASSNVLSIYIQIDEWLNKINLTAHESTPTQTYEVNDISVLVNNTSVPENITNGFIEKIFLQANEIANRTNDLCVRLTDISRNAKEVSVHVTEIALRGKDNQNVLTNFLRDLSEVILNMENDALKNLIDMLSAFLNLNRLKDFGNFTGNDAFYDYIKFTVLGWTNTKPDKLKNNLLAFKASRKGSALSQFAKELNIYFNKDDVQSLNAILKQLSKLTATKKYAKDPVKEILNFLVFDRYNRLNDTAKTKLQNDIKDMDKFWYAQNS